MVHMSVDGILPEILNQKLPCRVQNLVLASDAMEPDANKLDFSHQESMLSKLAKAHKSV
jgi:hypothetical protein